MELRHGDTYSQLMIQHLEPSNIIGGRWINPRTFLRMMLDGSMAAAVPVYIQLSQDTDRKQIRVLKWQQMEYFPSYYDKMTFYGNGKYRLEVLNRKLKVHQQLLPSGKTSHKIDLWTFDQETDDPLIVTSVVMINVDHTHRPTALGESYKQLTPENCQFDTKRSKMDPSNQSVSEMPLDVASFTSVSYVNVYQIDDNDHVNQSEYFDFCFDCISEAFFKSFFGDLGSIFNYNLRRVTFLYVKESLFRERIETTCWQISRNPLVFVFHCKDPKGLVCQTEFEFFSKSLDGPKL